MAVTYGEQIVIDALSYRLPFSSDATPPVSFRVYREGRLISSFESSDGEGYVDLAVASGDFPYVEVLDDDADVPALAFPGRLTLYWESAGSGVAEYKIEEYVASVWTERDRVPEEGAGAYSWESRWLEDQTSHQFRITPVGTDGNEGTALSFTKLMARHPDLPSVTITYDGSTPKTVTVAAA